MPITSNVPGGILVTEGDKSKRISGMVLIDPVTGLPTTTPVTPPSPVMTSGGHISATTATVGANYVPFGTQVCRQVTLSNQTGTLIEVRQDGAGVGFQIPTGAIHTFYGVINSDTLSIRRFDAAITQVTVTARWES